VEEEKNIKVNNSDEIEQKFMDVREENSQSSENSREKRSPAKEPVVINGIYIEELWTKICKCWYVYKSNTGCCSTNISKGRTTNEDHPNNKNNLWDRSNLPDLSRDTHFEPEDKSEDKSLVLAVRCCASPAMMTYPTLVVVVEETTARPLVVVRRIHMVVDDVGRGQRVVNDDKSAAVRDNGIHRPCLMEVTIEMAAAHDYTCVA